MKLPDRVIMRSSEIKERIARLRNLMKERQADACLITGADPHLSEYTPDNWKTLEWISGFTGSYGKVLITQEKALLWTDTRYFLQVQQELSGTGIELMKDRVLHSISVEDWIMDNLENGNCIWTNGLTISTAEANQISSKVGAKGIALNIDSDLVGEIWLDRPSSPIRQAYEHLERFAGRSRKQKIELVRESLISRNLDGIIISQLDDLAWLFNLRSDEIPYTPLVTAYGFIDLHKAFLFIDPGKLPDELRILLAKDGITIHSYDSFFIFLTRIRNQHLQFDPLRTNAQIYRQISTSNMLDPSVSIITHLKSIKDQYEIENIRNAHLKDGAAMVYSLFWINQNINKEVITEVSFGKKLNDFRSNQQFFTGDSFHPVVGFGSHGAIVHYHATPESDRIINPDNLLLIDSGGQYLDGTTDITRTISMGSSTQKQKEDFTTCLKGHIALATAIFPEGTKGYSLDALARKHLWDKGINYGHGTGHGIGYFLGVHEGPMSIRTEFNSEPIREGHLLSNEPGIYRTEEYGVRIENVLLCKRHSSSDFGNFLSFETISFCPIDKMLIISELLSSEEIKWVNHYHETVYRKISPLIIDPDVMEWLKEQCAPLNYPL
ncbi:MAG TPA: aminopeptidase P family protein [Prolixibacteraceae bacterium]